jgi:hypothetical protein
MAYINQPPDLRAIQADVESRLRKLETAQRFTSPAVATDPTYPRTGDLWYNSASDKLKALLSTTVELVTTGVLNTFTALQTFAAGLTVSVGNLIITLGNLTVSAGSISAGTTVTAGTGVTATTGNISATAGSVSAGTTVVAGTGVTATTGNITATAGTISGTGLSITGGSTLTTSLNLNSFSTATTVGAAGAATVPPLPVGYVTIQISGTNYKIPYYNV